ncbi:MAG: MBL fold metallo-hydrolase [Cellvibrionales bacterium]|nr:MBL fold metallo-hydrolase [Cellvibrionales bacterium]
MRFCSLGSGSKGNATLVQSDEALVMIDCGFPLKVTLPRLADMGVSPEQIDAILVTHEHGDHIGGVSRLARKFDIPVYLTQGTYRSKKVDEKTKVTFIQPDMPLHIKDMLIHPVTVPHDAREPCQFVIEKADRSLGVLTDLGSLSPHVQRAFSDCDALVLEANHDVDMLMNGPYPPSLRARVAGNWGHLSNQQAFDFLQGAGVKLPSTLVLGHISMQNNSEDKVKSVFSSIESQVPKMHYATQDEGYDWLDV